ncbi:hypothetical protein LEP1GSC032_2342 [Leptospira interrogans str. 2002000631]|nr:hypothetical protein LEP1GSC032_2342 [Leptospira interrogans str. 2002000631]
MLVLNLNFFPYYKCNLNINRETQRTPLWIGVQEKCLLVCMGVLEIQ